MVCKCVWLVTAVLMVILLFNLTKQHYMPPTDFCAFAKVCNHTEVALCGVEEKNESSRLFLDECDLYEYNCDNHKGYTETNIEKCTSIATVTSSTKPSTTLVSGIEINDTMANVSKTVNTTEFIMKTTSETVSTNNSSSNVTCVCPTVILCPNITSITSLGDNSNTSSTNTTVSSINMTQFINSTEETSMENTKVTNVLTNTTTSIEAIANYTGTEAMAQLTSAKAVTNLTVAEATTELTTTQETTINVTATLVLSSNSTVTTFNVTCTSNPTSTTREEINTLSVPISESASTTYKITPTTKVAKNTTGKEEIKTSQAKCKYPKHCNRPITWETTAKGETRDFYQILRAQFGDRVKVLRGTTHFPRRIATDFSNDDGFQFGYHNEKTNEIE